MQAKTQKLIAKLTKKWEEARSLQNTGISKREKYETSFTTVNGTFSWNNASLVLLADFVEGGGYEEYGSIVGLDREGRLMWEYQSHCSCYDFGDSTSMNGELNKDILEKKQWELSQVPENWEEKIQESIEKLLAAL